MKTSDRGRVLGLSPRARRVVVPVMVLAAVLLVLALMTGRGSAATPVQGGSALVAGQTAWGR